MKIYTFSSYVCNFPNSNLVLSFCLYPEAILKVYYLGVATWVNKALIYSHSKSIVLRRRQNLFGTCKYKSKNHFRKPKLSFRNIIYCQSETLQLLADIQKLQQEENKREILYCPWRTDKILIFQMCIFILR